MYRYAGTVRADAIRRRGGYGVRPETATRPRDEPSRCQLGREIRRGLGRRASEQLHRIRFVPVSQQRVFAADVGTPPTALRRFPDHERGHIPLAGEPAAVRVFASSLLRLRGRCRAGTWYHRCAIATGSMSLSKRVWSA
jgi:hypothetical protein